MPDKIKQFLLFLLMILCLPFATGQAKTLFAWEQIDGIGEPNQQAVLSLAGKWQYKEKEDESWSTIDLPSFLARQGQFVFKKTFAPDSAFAAGAYTLSFRGVDGACTVYLNGNLLGSHSSRSPFSFSVAGDQIFIGKQNELVLEIDSRLNFKSTLPLVVRDSGLPPSGGGIFADVTVIAHRPPFIRKLSISTPGDLSLSPLTLNIKADLLLPPQTEVSASAKRKRVRPPVKYTARLLQANAKKPVWSAKPRTLPEPEKEQHSLLFEVAVANPLFWSPEQPRLYTLEIMVTKGYQTLSRFRIDFGLQETKFDTVLMVNGVATKLKAINWVYDLPLHRMSAGTLNARIKKDLQTIKSLGANIVRVYTGAPPEPFLATCDSLGLGVLLEIPVLNVPGRILQNEVFAHQAEIAIKDLILAFRNHPSVLAWGLGDGFDASDLRTRDFMQRMIDLVKSLDARPVYAGIVNAPDTIDLLPVDFGVIKVFPQNYTKTVNALPASKARVICQIIYPLLSQTSDLKLAERRQALFVKNALTHCLQDTSSAGIIIHSLRDWYGDSPHTLYGPRAEANLFLSGLLDVRGKQRQVCSVVSALFRGQESPEILPARKATSETIIFQILGFAISLIFLFLYKSDRRLRELIRRIFLYPHGFYMDLNENRRINTFLSVFVGIIEFSALATIITSLLYFVRKNLYFDEILTWLFPNPEMKFKAIWLVWHPLLLVLLLVIVMFLLAFLQILFIKILILFQRRLFKLRSIFVFTMWVPANFLFLLPLTIVSYRILEKPSLSSPFLIYVGLVLLWFFIRTFRGMKVILQYTVARTLALFLSTVVVILLAGVFYLDMTRSFFSYAQYFFHIW